MPTNSKSLTDQLYKIKPIKSLPDSASELDTNNLQSPESLTNQLYNSKPISPNPTPKSTDWKPEAFQTLLGYENADLVSGKKDSSTSYWDNKQYSVGYGTKSSQGKVQNEAQSRLAAQDKFNLSVTEAKNLLPSGRWDSLPNKAKGVLSRLVYQVGFAGAKKFTKTLDSIKNEDYAGAAKEYLNSKLPKTRAQKEAGMLSSLGQSGPKPLTDQLANKDLRSLTSQLYNEAETKTKTPPTFKESFNTVKLSIDPYNVLSPGLITTIGARNYNPEDKAKLDNIIVNNLKDLGSLATSPKEIVRGGLELLSSVPGFLTGAVIAASKMSRELMDQVVLGQTLNLNELHNIATQGMVEGAQLTNPIKDAVLKSSTPESRYMVQLIMAPLTAMSAIGNKVANYEGFKDYPNIQGAAKFTGDVLGLVALGMVHEGVSKKAPTKELEDITNKANDLITEDQNIAVSPDEVTKQIQQKINDIKKLALEKEAAKIAEKIKQDQEIKQTKEDQNTKVDEALNKPEVVKEPEPANDEVSKVIEEVNKDNNTNIRYLGYWEGFGPIEGFHSFSVPLKDGSETSVSVKDLSELQNAYNETMKKFGQDRSIVEQTKGIKVYRGGDSETDISRGGKNGISVTTDKETAKQFTISDDEKVDEFTLPLNTKILKEGNIPKDLLSDYLTKAKKLDETKIYGSDTLFNSLRKSVFSAQAKIVDYARGKNYDAVEFPFEKEIRIIKSDILKRENGSEIGQVNEPITDVDRGTGTEVPTLSGEDSPFFQDPETTNKFKSVYESRPQAVAENPETFMQKLINDVNRWYHGDKSIDIEKVRNGLSELATRGDELRGQFLNGTDFNNWKTLASEAATWARRIEPDRSTIEQTKSDHSVTLNAGIPLDQITKEIVDDAKRLAEYTKKARGIKAFKPREAMTRTRESFNRSIIDRSGNIRIDLLKSLSDEGYRIIQKMYLSKGASSRSAEMLRQMQKEVYSGLNRNEKNILDNLILADRMIDIGKYKTEKQFKFPEGLSPKESVAYSELVGPIEKLSDPKVKDLRNRTKAYYEWMKKPLKDMLDAGLITEEEFKNLSSHNYRRLKLVEIYDREYKTKIGKKIKTVYDSGVESLARGRDTDIFEPSSEVMALEVFNRAYGRIANNEANKTLLDLATRDPENPFVRTKTNKKTKIPTGWNRIFMFDEGKRRALYLSPEMNREWINSSPELSYKMSQILRYSTGSPVLRTFATGINWGFALANLPRDIMQTWFAARIFKDGEWSSVYSPIAPLYALQLGHDYATIFTDAALKKGRYEDYIKEGGGMEFLVHQGRLFQRGRHIERPIDKFYTLMGRFGETSELMTRLAIRERVIRRRAREQGITLEEARKNKSITTEATFAARDYMDFGQGGGIAKAFDNGIPYLNAAIQGTRGMFRSFKPGSGTALSSTFKLAQFAAVVSGLYIAARKLSPQTMKNLQGNMAMQNNLCIPLGDHFSFVDNEGQTRYIYVKIPLDPGQKFFKTFFEASVDKWLGNEVDVDRVTGALEQISPVSLTGLPPTLSAALGYMTNKNFWSNSDIWRATDKPFDWPNSSQEYTNRTPQIAVDFGKLTGLSPERTKYAVNQLITNGSIWSYMAGGAYNKLFGTMPKDKKEQNIAMILARTPVIKRFIGVTNPYSKYRKDISEAKEMSSLKTFIQNRGLDTLSDGYLFKGITKRSDIFKYINSFHDRNIQNRLIERFKVQERTKDLPERSFWLQLQELKPDARAAVFMDRLTRLDRDRKSEVWKEFSMMNRMSKGIFTSRFRHEVMKIRAKLNK